MSIGTTFKVENGALTTTSGTIADWTIISGCLYKITAGAIGPPFTATGVVINASNASAPLGLDVFSAGVLRFAAGQVDTGVFGMRCYDGSSNVILKVDTGGTLIAGWTIATTGLYTGSKTAYNDTNTGIHLGSDGIGIGNNVFTVSAVGALVATSGTVAGWTISSTEIYKLGVPTSNGIVLNSTYGYLRVYEGTVSRIQLGYLSSGVYGIIGYDTGGSTEIFQLSDTAQRIAGWSFDNTKIYLGGVGVTPANGFPVSPGSLMELRAGAAVPVNFVGQTGKTPEIRTLELS